MGTVTSKSNIFQRFFQGVIGVFIGILLIVGMFALAIWSETRENPANVAKDAKEITINTVADAAAHDGKFVAFKGKAVAEGTTNDQVLKNPNNYVYLFRQESVYAYVQSESTSKSTSLGGTETTVTTYTYKLGWTDNVKTDFSNDTSADTDGYRALATSVNNAIVNAPDYKAPESKQELNSKITVNGVVLNATSITFKQAQALVPTLDTINDGYSLGADNYIYKYQSGTTATAGDLRVSYSAVKTNTDGMVIGKLDQAVLGAYVSKRDTKICTFVAGIGSKTELITYLNKENSARLFVFRIIVIIGMILGFLLITGPLTIILSIIPFLGRAGKVVQFIFAAIVGLIFGVVAILIGILARFWFITVPVLVALIILLIVLGARKKRKSTTKAQAQ